MWLFGAIAQLGERLLCKQEVVGSIPSGSTILKKFEERFCRDWEVLVSRPKTDRLIKLLQDKVIFYQLNE